MSFETILYSLSALIFGMYWGFVLYIYMEARTYRKRSRAPSNVVRAFTAPLYRALPEDIIFHKGHLYRADHGEEKSDIITLLPLGAAQSDISESRKTSVVIIRAYV